MVARWSTVISKNRAAAAVFLAGHGIVPISVSLLVLVRYLIYLK